MSAKLGTTITELVEENRRLYQRLAEEKTTRLSLVARRKEMERRVERLEKEKGELEGSLRELKGKVERERTIIAVGTPKGRTRISEEPMTPVSPIPFKLGRKRGGVGGGGLASSSRAVEVESGKRRRIEEEVDAPVDPEKVRGTGPVVGIKVGGVAWVVGVDGVVDELGRQGYAICDGSRWLVNEDKRGRQIANGKTSSTVVAFVRGGEDVDRLFRMGMWLAGRWYSVRRFLAVKPVRKVDRWKQVKVAIHAGRKRTEQVYRLVEALLGSEEEVRKMEEEEIEKDFRGESDRFGKGEGVEAKKAKGKEKEVRVEEEEEADMGQESKADMDWRIGSGRSGGEMVESKGYCNSCRGFVVGIGRYCKVCNTELM